MVERWLLGTVMALRCSETEVPQNAWLSFSEMNGNGDTGYYVTLGGGQAKIFRVIGMWRYGGRQGVDHCYGTWDHCLILVSHSSSCIQSAELRDPQLSSATFKCQVGL